MIFIFTEIKQYAWNRDWKIDFFWDRYFYEGKRAHFPRMKIFEIVSPVILINIVLSGQR